MSDIASQVRAQLTEELGEISWNIGAFLSAAEGTAWRAAAAAPAERAAALLCSDEVNNGAVSGVVMSILWPHVLPHRAERPEWWRTPLGVTCARGLLATTHPCTLDSVTYEVAGSVAGVTEGAVKAHMSRARQGLSSGGFEPHQDGGVVFGSALRRIITKAGVAPWA